MGSTQTEVEVSYDVSNEFFRLWLDERMNYTSGIFDDGDWHTNSLEEAQLRKLAWHHDAAKLTPEKRLLDIGCGWGANIEYQHIDRGVKEVHGITLSRAQHAEIMRRTGSEGIETIMWLVRRGALQYSVMVVHKHYHEPISNTGAGVLVLENTFI